MTPLHPDADHRTDGRPDLSLCEQEPIHVPGAIQPHGCLIACAMANWIVTAVSANSAAYLGQEPAAVLDRALDDILPHKTVHDLRNVLQSSMVSGAAERLIGARIDASDTARDLTIHVSGPYAVIEILEAAGSASPTSDPLALVKNMIGRTKRAPNLDRFLHLATSQIRAVTGFDRVMLYRFLDDQSGKVVAESLRSGLTPYLGLRYPASDIPAQARALYKRQWLRLIPDIGYTPVPLLTRATLPTDIDLSLAVLRSVSPVHLEYLHNMGSRATLTLSLLDGDDLWGLIACHHETPRRLSSATCAAAELFGQVFSLQIEAKVQAHGSQGTARARDAHDRLLASLSPEETMFDNLERFAGLLRELIPCDGLSVYSEKGYFAVGETPQRPRVDALLDVLGDRPASESFVTDRLGEILPPGLADPDGSAGVIAIPFTRTPRNYLMFFRKEVLQTVSWGGDPNKPVEPGGGGFRIGPRKSFAAWRETVRGRCEPWTEAQVRIAETLRVSLLDVILRRSDLVAQERQTAQERQSFLIAELNHRVKNILALIGSLVRQTRVGTRTVEGFADDLEHRIVSLALAHDQLTAAGWRDIPLRRLLDAEVRAWAHAPTRILFEGPPVTLGSRAIQSLALVFHELVTNAAKHGSLSRPEGRLSVVWSKADEGALRIEWREIDGPPVSPPSRHGFGSAVVRQVIPFELGGEAALDYRPEGLYARFVIPAVHVGGEEASADALVIDEQPKEWSFKRLLLVEDSMMIALDARAMLHEPDVTVEVAGTAADAQRLIDAQTFDAGVLDINLSGDTSFGVADELIRRAVPFVFATGYGEGIAVPERFKGIPIVSKPYDKRALKTALAAAVPAAEGSPSGSHSAAP